MSYSDDQDETEGTCDGVCDGCGERVAWRFVCAECLGQFCIWCTWPDEFICRGCFMDRVFPAAKVHAEETETDDDVRIG